MRLPFEFNNSKFEDARIKFVYTSPKHDQNIEMSMNGDEATVEELLDTFHRFLGALGIYTPEDVVLGFIKLSEDQDDEEDSENDDKE